MNTILSKKQKNSVKIIDLPLKSQWYDQIESLIKEEEYRRITWWILSRIVPPPIIEGVSTGRYQFLDAIIANEYEKANTFLQQWEKDGLLPSSVRFRYGYTKRTMLFHLGSIRVGIGNPEWAHHLTVLILKIGKKLE